ncbi:MAG: hypothetical protein IPL05_01820 [Betaproteobacteria bacterium]|nr:hypothetical protein [Betaproteobacteria bacterium]
MERISHADDLKNRNPRTDLPLPCAASNCCRTIKVTMARDGALSSGMMKEIPAHLFSYNEAGLSACAAWLGDVLSPVLALAQSACSAYEQRVAVKRLSFMFARCWRPSPTVLTLRHRLRSKHAQNPFIDFWNALVPAIAKTSADFHHSGQCTHSPRPGRQSHPALDEGVQHLAFSAERPTALEHGQV